MIARPHPAAMAVTEILALLAATVSAGASPGERSASAQLGVTATVVRPAEFVAVSAADDGTVAIVRNSESVEVLASGGTVDHTGDDTAAVSSDGADTVLVTLVY